jgi:DNA mismatch repair protein MSH4
LLQLIIKSVKPTLQTTEQAINQVIQLKQFLASVNPVFEALTGARSSMLNNIREVRVRLFTMAHALTPPALCP